MSNSGPTSKPSRTYKFTTLSHVFMMLRISPVFSNINAFEYRHEQYTESTEYAWSKYSSASLYFCKLTQISPEIVNCLALSVANFSALLIYTVHFQLHVWYTGYPYPFVFSDDCHP